MIFILKPGLQIRVDSTGTRIRRILPKHIFVLKSNVQYILFTLHSFNRASLLIWAYLFPMYEYIYCKHIQTTNINLIDLPQQILFFLLAIFTSRICCFGTSSVCTRPLCRRPAARTAFRPAHPRRTHPSSSLAQSLVKYGHIVVFDKPLTHSASQ